MDLEHEKRLTEVEGRCKSNTHRLDDVESRLDKQDEMVAAVKVLAVREEAVENDVKEIKQDVKTLTGKSGKRWDDFMDKLFWAVAAAVVGFLLARIGL